MTVVIFSDFGVKHFEDFFLLWSLHITVVIICNNKLGCVFQRTLSNDDEAQYLIKISGLLCTELKLLGNISLLLKRQTVSYLMFCSWLLGKPE